MRTVISRMREWSWTARVETATELQQREESNLQCTEEVLCKCLNLLAPWVGIEVDGNSLILHEFARGRGRSTPSFILLISVLRNPWKNSADTA